MYKMVNGELIALSPEEIAARTPTLDQAKQGRIAEVAQKKWLVETGGVAVGGATIDTTRESQGLINGAYNLAVRNANTPGFAIDFRGSDGWVTLDAAAMVIIGEAVAAHIQATFTRYRQLEEAIAACSSVDEVAAIDIDAGWPG